ncbi:MAG: hypothetical protein MR434_09895 [Ruminococcus sp.]|nr:hypothetical protein [Ruminococcus sp.]
MSMIYLAVGLVAIGAVGFVGIKFLKKPKKTGIADNDNSDDDDITWYDNEDEINEDDEWRNSVRQYQPFQSLPCPANSTDKWHGSVRY